MTKTRRPWLGLAFVAALTGCSPTSQPTAAADTRAADEEAIRKTDAEWVKAAQTRQVDAWVAFYSDDAVLLPPNEKLASDKASIRKNISDLLGLPGVSVKWQPTKVEVARSGDLGYLYGAYDLTFNDAKGKPVSDRGKILEIWKKQPGGDWKCIVDTWSSDLPAAPPPK